jgi:hypothetical protein
MRMFTLLALSLITTLALALMGCPPAEDGNTTEEATAGETAEAAEGAEEEGDCPHSKAHHGEEAEAAHPWSILHSEGVERAAENLDNGVKISFTAGCPHLQGKLQEGAAAKVAHMGEEGHQCECGMHGEGVTVAAENLDNGVALVISTENADDVAKLQEHGAKMASGEAGCGGCKGHGGHEGHEGHGHGEEAAPVDAGAAEGSCCEDGAENEKEDCGCDEEKK